MKTQVKTYLHSNHTRQEKFRYLVQIYWRMAAVILVLLVIAVWLIVPFFNKKTDVLNVGMYSGKYSVDNSTKMEKKFASWITYNKRKQQVIVTWGDSTQTAMQEKMYATISANTVDILITDPGQFKNFEKQGGLTPLPISKAKATTYKAKLVFNSKGQPVALKASQSPLLKKWGLKQQLVYVLKKSPNKAHAKVVINQLLTH